MAAENVDLPIKDASPSADPSQRPQPCHYASAPSFDSPQRHHRRNPMARRRPIKETLNARSEYTTSQDDGTAEHRINQYVIKQEIGRGSFGAVHLAVDQFGNEFAVKEFSKSRLRKRAQSHLLRRPRGPKRPSDGFNSPLHRRSLEGGQDEKQNALYLIKEEIAIMKKLNHNNLVSLIEVLDDPTEDSLYMVMEMCKKGVVMKVGLEERADPYDDHYCRCWCRDLILGIEYLHAQGIVHRDIKPDNCLVTSDDVLKVVDFGVSEMFEKDSNMYTAKSAGSPAFLPPELCVVRHGDVSGKAADIWSMGVTLYCLRYGRLPFEKESIFELYEAIKNDAVDCEGEQDQNFKDLMSRILEKDPAKRITMEELRKHPWVTKDGMDPLLSESENTAQIIGLPTEEEMNSAITKPFSHVLAVMKAVKNFKRLIDPSKADPPMQSILGQEHESHFVAPPLEMEPDEDFPEVGMISANKSQSLDTENRKYWGLDDTSRGYQSGNEPSNDTDSASRQDSIPGASIKSNVQPDFKDSGSIRSTNFRGELEESASQSPQIPLSRASSATTKRSVEGTRGHARDPLEEEFPFLFIGPSTYTGSSPPGTSNPGDETFEEPENIISSEPTEMDTDPIVSESPGAAEFDIYETAYRQEIERIRSISHPRQGTTPKVYLTRRVEGKDDVMKLVGSETPATFPLAGAKNKLSSMPSFGSAVSAVRAQLAEQEHKKQQQQQQQEQETAPSEQNRASQQQLQSQPPSSLSAQSIPEPATSSTAATGTTVPEPSSPEDSKTKLRTLLGRAKGSRG